MPSPCRYVAGRCRTVAGSAASRWHPPPAGFRAAPSPRTCGRRRRNARSGTASPAPPRRRAIAPHGSRHDGEVRPCRCRPQEGLGRVQPDAAALVDLEIGAAVIVSAIEIRHRRNAGLVRRRAKGIEDFPGQTLALHAPFAAAAVGGAGAQPVVFAFPEQRQHVFPAPGSIACDVGPTVVVVLAARFDQQDVDIGTPAQAFASTQPAVPAPTMT